MNNPPAFQFYPKDFLADANVQAMTLEETGAYIRLLCACWIEDGIPTETAQKMVDLWLVNGSTKGEPTVNLWSKIKHCFYEKDDKWRNKRLDEERKKQIVWSEKSRRGGLKSGESKRLRKGGYTKGKPKVNQTRTKGKPKANSSVFSLQSSSSKSIEDSRESSVEKTNHVGANTDNIKSLWNEFAAEHNLASITKVDPKSERGRHLAARMAEKDWDFPKLLEAVSLSPFLLGKKGKEPFFVTFDWLLWPGNYQRTMEGNYKDRKSNSWDEFMRKTGDDK